MIQTRFAPSPTGALHVGNARIALFNALFARHSGWRFLLRIDDTDTERNVSGAIDAIETDLRWLGIEWDETVHQSKRLAAYQAALERLVTAGRVYACFDTAEELALRRKALLMAGKAPIYERTGLTLSPEEQARHEAEGRRPHYRFLLPEKDITITDLVQGPVTIPLSSLSDPVVMREDGRPLYTLTSVVDDLELGIGAIFRGADHLTNTAAQIALFQALGCDGADLPVVGHLPILKGEGGKPLSKRTGEQSVQQLRQAGFEPETIIGYLASLGLNRAATGSETLQSWAESFSTDTLSKSEPRFLINELDRLNHKVIQNLSGSEVMERLALDEEGGGNGKANPSSTAKATMEVTWPLIREHLTRRPDAQDWLRRLTPGFRCRADEYPELWQVLDKETAHEALLAVEVALTSKEIAFDGDDWPEILLTTARKSAGLKGIKGKAFFLPQRLALSGAQHGPELAPLIAYLGTQEVLARTQAAKASLT